MSDTSHRVFSFTDQQQHSLEDYVETSVMLQYNLYLSLLTIHENVTGSVHSSVYFISHRELSVTESVGTGAGKG